MVEKLSLHHRGRSISGLYLKYKPTYSSSFRLLCPASQPVLTLRFDPSQESVPSYIFGRRSFSNFSSAFGRPDCWTFLPLQGVPSRHLTEPLARRDFSDYSAGVNLAENLFLKCLVVLFFDHVPKMLMVEKSEIPTGGVGCAV